MTDFGKAQRIMRKTMAVAGKDRAQELRPHEQPGKAPFFPGRFADRVSDESLAVLAWFQKSPIQRIHEAAKR